MAVAGARAEEVAAPRTYAVLSLVGDSMNVVSFQMATGSNIDRNRHESIPVPDRTFDTAALIAVNDSLKRINSQNSAVFFVASSPGLFKDQAKLFDGRRLVLPDELSVGIKKAGATHLLLLTKHRDEARLQAAGEKLGSGTLEGIGFYIDRVKPMQQSDTGQEGRGFLAPFVYMKISLVDLATSTVARQQVAMSTNVYAATRTKDGLDPWDVLSVKQKVDVLRQMISDEVARIVPLLVTVP
jgi:hypothetical protein